MFKEISENFEDIWKILEKFEENLKIFYENCEKSFVKFVKLGIVEKILNIL